MYVCGWVGRQICVNTYTYSRGSNLAHSYTYTYIVGKFNAWAENLYLCVDVNDKNKQLLNVNLQQDGGFQNTYIYGRREDGGVVVDKSKKDKIFAVTFNDEEIFRGGNEVNDAYL